MSTAHSAPVSHPPTPTATEDILQLIYQGTATTTGEDFFRALTRATASAMQVHFCFVAEFAGCRERVSWSTESFGSPSRQ